MYLPSADQLTEVSRAAGLKLILRISPFFAGTVKISPLAAKTARLPAFEIAIDSIVELAFLKTGCK